jgi:ribosomal subunit interface protein
MLIEVQAHGFDLTDALRSHVERRVRFALSHRGYTIARVRVRLADVNASRGGIDKRCLVRVQLDGLPEVLVEDVQPDLYSAVDQATGRASRSVSRALERRNARRQTPVPDYVEYFDQPGFEKRRRAHRAPAAP